MGSALDSERYWLYSTYGSHKTLTGTDENKYIITRMRQEVYIHLTTNFFSRSLQGSGSHSSPV
jgi:hypothetical protein